MNVSQRPASFTPEGFAKADHKFEYIMQQQPGSSPRRVIFICQYGAKQGVSLSRKLEGQFWKHEILKLPRRWRQVIEENAVCSTAQVHYEGICSPPLDVAPEEHNCIDHGFAAQIRENTLASRPTRSKSSERLSRPVEPSSYTYPDRSDSSSAVSPQWTS
ncbi:hypothetical protein WN51_01471 [Melipona quadrifasciata]|uniref:Uncharacterized protein n=1 Tax=Melipona quadrifasciata TaxID=166423 RepID=A0A0N0BF02_9HYME|nr:hypothetical protein WN51_01471 [Melipona quadrifasciata]